MRHLDLFSGIGGFALAVDEVWPGSEHIFCEIDTFCSAVLKKHWPNSINVGDIKQLTALSIFDNIESCQTKEAKNMTKPSISMIGECQSATFPNTTTSLDKQCGKSSQGVGANSEIICGSAKTIISSEEQKQTAGHTTCLKGLSKKGLLKEKHIAKLVATQALSKMGPQKSKHITPIIPSHSKSCGFAKNAITNGIGPTGRQEAPNEATARKDRKIDLLTGGFP